MVVDLIREIEEGQTYLVPKQVAEMMKNLYPMVEKCDTDYPSKLSDTKGMLWTYYHQAIIDQSDLMYVSKKMDELNKKFRENCSCKKQ